MGKVLVVNEKDELMGGVDKEEAVDKSLIRRVSVAFLCDGKGKILLQRRSKNKKTYPLCWVSSITGHVEIGESYAQAVYRELEEELGVKGVVLEQLDKVFTSKEEDLNGLPKFTVIFVGKYKGEFKLNEFEVKEVKWFSIDEVKELVSQKPLMFTPTFNKVFRQVAKKLKKYK